jgi:hypothetical protein
MRILDHLIQTIRSAAAYNAEAQVAPACILWPDPNRQWQAALPALLAAMPELFVLGAYDPAARTGPAIWLRGVLAGVLPPGAAPPGWDEERNSVSPVSPPVFYLPGFSRQELRDVNTCPAELKPLVELQFRGAIWAQVNARDWTILAFLQSARGGLGLDVAVDAETRSAMQGALTWLLDEELAALHGRRLEAIDFNRLIVEDPVRDLLHWIDQEDAFRQQRGPEAWQAFADITRTQYGLDPARDSVLDGAAALAARKGAWQQVWARFCEAPQRYTAIPDRIRRCTMSTPDLFASAATHEGWPQWNDLQETALRAELRALRAQPPHSVRRRIADLEQQHGARRRLVWAALGQAPLARALKALADLAAATELSLAAGASDELVDGYQRSGWRADNALLAALAAVKTPEDHAAVLAAAGAMYVTWAETAARYLQQLVETTGYPGGGLSNLTTPLRQPGRCMLFVDGLRFDLAQQLAERLTAAGSNVASRPRWSALPSVTATAKPATTPVADQIRGADATSDFDPLIAATRQSLKGGYHLHKLLEDAGWQVLAGEALGDPTGSAWCEAGSIDTAQGPRALLLAPVPGAHLRRRVPAGPLLRDHRRGRDRRGLADRGPPAPEPQVRAGEEELFKARASEQGSVRIIDLVSARLDAKTDSYLVELPEPAPARRSHHPRSGPPARADAHRRLLRRGRAGVRRRHRPGGHGRPFGVASLREIQLSKRDVLGKRSPRAAASSPPPTGSAFSSAASAWRPTG